MKQTVLLVTHQSHALAPIQSVIEAVLHYEPIMTSPDRAMTSAEHSEADLIIIDMQSGDRLSRALIKPLKQKFPMIPIIALVPYADLTAIEEALSHGADDYISQPIALERLRTSLRNALKMRHLLVSLSGNVLPMSSYNQELQMNEYLRASCGRLKTMREVEELVIHYAIDTHAGCITQAARALGIGRSTLYRKIQEMPKLEAAYISRANHTTLPTMLASASAHS